jgi:hypothetical protein
VTDGIKLGWPSMESVEIAVSQQAAPNRKEKAILTNPFSYAGFFSSATCR